MVGSALGDDPEHLAQLGYAVTAFDVSPTAVERARARFPGSAVDYRVADLLHPPAEWAGAFMLVLEAITVQSMPVETHAEAIAAVRGFVAPGGRLLVVSGAREEGEAVDGPPYPLTRPEVESFAADGLAITTLEALDGRWRAWLRRTG